MIVLKIVLFMCRKCAASITDLRVNLAQQQAGVVVVGFKVNHTRAQLVEKMMVKCLKVQKVVSCEL